MRNNLLILSENFSAGDAITTLNLFCKWDKSDLYCASRNASYFHGNFKSGYYLGNAEVVFNFPLRFFFKSQPSRIVDTESLNDISCTSEKKVTNWKLKLYSNVIIPTLQFTGLLQYRFKYLCSSSFLTWIDSLNLKYIYSSVGSPAMADFVLLLMHLRPHIKWIIHNYDDWTEPNYRSINSKSFKRHSQKALYLILNNAHKTFTSSEKMAREYSILYKREFLFFPNPVKLPQIISQKTNNVVFLGKIGNHNIVSLKSMAMALSKLSESHDLTLIFDIYSNQDVKYEKSLKGVYNHCVFHQWVTREEVYKILYGASILFLPISINTQTIKFTKYSMSTKMAEYLASGSPVIFQGPPQIAMTEFLETYNCATVIKHLSVDELIAAVKDAYQMGPRIQRQLENAQKTYKECFDQDIISTNFKNSILAP